MSKQESIIILDGNALLHRAWHALPPLTTKDGTMVNAAYGFAMVVEKMIEQEKPTYMAVAWDLPGKTFRHEKFEAYKGHRPEKEQELYDQIPLIQQILETFGIPSFSAEGFEADDIIATLATKAVKKGIFAKVVTGDLDALQLVNEQTNVLFFKKGISEIKVYDTEAVQERYGLTPAQLIDYKALRGDPSDNIPGVAGIGDKTATELVKEFGSIEGIIDALKQDLVVEKFAKKLTDQQQAMRDSRELVELVHTVPLSFRFASAKLKEPNWKRVIDLYRELEFRTLLRKHAAHVSTPPPPKGRISETSAIDIVRGAGLLEGKLAELATETVGLLVADQPADLFGATLAVLAVSDGVRTVVVPNPAPEQMKKVQTWLDRAGRVAMHDVKKTLHATGWEYDAKFFDVMIASYLLHPGSRAHDIASSVKEFLDLSLSELPQEYGTDRAYTSIGETVQHLPKLSTKLLASLEEAGMKAVFEEIDLPLIPVLKHMEDLGIELDVDALNSFAKELKKELQHLTETIHALAGREFNVNSPSQLAEVLFDTLHLPTKGIKKTKSGYSTAASELEKLVDAHAIVPLISEYREKEKLRSTYVETLPELVADDGRVHTTFNQTVAATGRLSSTSPNLQNIPIKTELGNKIRKAFVAGKGKVLVAADYSQIELRLAAVIANDQPFIQAFKDGADIHTRTASEVWEVAESDVTKEQRRAAKAINFGILYGMGPRSLARSTNMNMEEAKQFIEKYFEIHHAIRKYLDETKEKAHVDGFVETMFGRKRFLPEITSGVPMLVAMAERMAINMPVQGTAADIMKKAMVAVDGWLEASEWPADVLLQVHDELVLEVNKDAVDAVARGVKEMMEGVATFDVPLIVDVEVGQNWGELEKWNS